MSSLVSEILQRIGNIPVGDPAAMRAHAARLSAEAELVEQRARQVTQTVDGTQYQAPAADRLRAGANDRQARLLSAAARLRQLAGDLMRSAGNVEHAQSEWHTAFARVEADLEQALRKH